jgi:phage shock protein PspC (stress-responsive transcriptional regulator)
VAGVAKFLEKYPVLVALIIAAFVLSVLWTIMNGEQFGLDIKLILPIAMILVVTGIAVAIMLWAMSSSCS